MDSSSFMNQSRSALLRRLGVQPIQTAQPFTQPQAGGFTPAGTAGFTPAGAQTRAGDAADDDDVPAGKACTRNKDCGKNKACIDGFCQKPDQSLDGRQCTRSNQCPPGKNCVNGNCVPKTGGGGGGGPTPEEEETTQGCRTSGDCDEGKVCREGVCTTPGGSGGACTTRDDCGRNERCVNGTCETSPTGPGEVYEDIALDPGKYLGNLARTGTLQADEGTAFGNFLSKRAFPNILKAYEEEGLTNRNLDFKEWLSRQNRFGNPNLTMVDRKDLPPIGDDDGTDPSDPGEEPNPAAGESCSKANPNGTCNGPNRVCRNGVCKKRKNNNNQDQGSGNNCGPDKPCPSGEVCGNNGKCKAAQCDGTRPCPEGQTCEDGKCKKDEDVAQQYDPSYQNVQGFANYLRDLYYGASSVDRGQNAGAYGQGATRWSAW